MAKAAMHGLTRSAITKAQGGKWSSGFWSGFASSAFAANSSWGKKLGTMVTAVVSGTVSSITGGKFANGAVTGAFVHLFNHTFKQASKIVKNSNGYATMYKDSKVWGGYAIAGPFDINLRKDYSLLEEVLLGIRNGFIGITESVGEINNLNTSNMSKESRLLFNYLKLKRETASGTSDLYINIPDKIDTMDQIKGVFK